MKSENGEVEKMIGDNDNHEDVDGIHPKYLRNGYLLGMPIMIVMTTKVTQTVGSVLAFIQKADGRAVVHRNLSRPVCRVQKFEYREYRV